jgi:hypothetical protein
VGVTGRDSDSMVTMIRIRHLLSRVIQRKLAVKPPGLSIRGVIDSAVGGVNNVHCQLRNWTRPNEVATFLYE